MAVAIDAVSSFAHDGNSHTLSHTIAGSNLYLLVGVSLIGSVGRAVSAATAGGVALTSLGSIANSTTYRTEFWRLIAPPTGTNNIIVSTSGPPTTAVIGAMSFTGVDQTTPESGFTSATGSSANPAITVSSAIGDMVAAVCIDAGGGSISVDQTLQWNLQMLTDTPRGAGATAAGASSVTTTFTGSNNLWAALGLNIKAAGGGGGGLPFFMQQNLLTGGMQDLRGMN